MISKSISYALILFLFFTSCKKEKENRIIIATAANMQFVMKELVNKFNTKHSNASDIVIGSSGKLTAQIKEGAPYDVFVAANMKYPQEIYTSGIAYGKPQIYAHGKLVLWSANKNITPSIDLLTSSQVKHIALANPKTAPYGLAALEMLEKLKLDTVISDKLVYGESISQTNQFITLQSVELGFTAMSVVLSPKMKNTGKWLEIDKSNYSPILQGVVVIKHNDTVNTLAIKFQNFLFTKEAQKILNKYGYDVP